MISVHQLKKTFYLGLRRRRVEAVRDMNLSVEPGEIFGFLGPNGAGKTTTIKALLGLIRPDAGTLALCGHPVQTFAWRAEVGYMPEHPNFYEFLTAFEMVAWFGRLAGLARHEAETRARRTLERVGLAHALDRRLRSYSKGMLQRAGLAQALIGSPKLLILDEPMTGLDPLGRRDIRELILELRKEGRTVFYSTHILPDVELTCDRVAICHRGETRRTGRLEDILTATTRGVTVVVEGEPAALARLASAHPDGARAGDTLELSFADADAARGFVAAADAAGARLVRFEPHRDTLEAIFVRTLGEAAGGDAAGARGAVAGGAS